MTIGDVIKDAIHRDLAGVIKGSLSYTELIMDGKFHIKLSHLKDKDAFIECSVPDDGNESSKNYLRLYFLSMAFHAAVWGMKKGKKKKFR